MTKTQWGVFSLSQFPDQSRRVECFDDDLEYLAGITLVGDLKIVWRTVGAVVHGTGN